MNTTNDSLRLVDELAGRWTDPALEILRDLGVPAVSIDLELATWRTLQQALQVELHQRPGVPSLEHVRAGVLRQATLLVAQQFAPWLDLSEWERERPAPRGAVSRRARPLEPVSRLRRSGTKDSPAVCSAL